MFRASFRPSLAGGHAAGPSGGHHKVDKPRTYLPESEVKLPLEVETRCMCLWRKTNTYQRVRHAPNSHHSALGYYR